MVIKISLVATTEVVSSAFKLLAQERICLSNSMSVQLKFSQAIFADHQLYCLFLQARVVTYVHIPWLLKANSGQRIGFTLSDVVNSLNKCILLDGM